MVLKSLSLALCGFSYLSSTWLILNVVNGADLGANVLQVRCRGVDRPGGSMSAGHRRLFLQRGLLGHRGFGDHPAAVGGAGVAVGGGGRSPRGGGGGRAGTSCRERSKKVFFVNTVNVQTTFISLVK